MNYEEGKWYWIEGQELSYIMRGGSIIDGKMTSNELYFIDGDSFDPSPVPLIFIYGLATPAQIEQCLKAYAQKNGYIEGALFKPANITSKKEYPITNKWEYEPEFDELLNFNIPVYCQGKWAEIVKEDPIKIIDSRAKEPNYGTLSKTKLEVRGEMVSIQDLIDGYQKYLDIKTIIG